MPAKTTKNKSRMKSAGNPAPKSAQGGVRKSTPSKAPSAAPPAPKGAQRPLADQVEAVVASRTLDKRRGSAAMNANAFVVCQGLKRLGTKKTRDGMARYAIPSDKAFGVPVGKIRDLGKRLGRNHELAAALWDTGWYEARMLAAFVDEPARVTPAQMDRWCRDFDSWAICDTVCFHLFDRTPHAWAKVEQWSDKRDEFVKRAAFALLASLALHDKHTGDEPFLECLPFIKRAATDERNFVKKGVSWALRGFGRRSPALHTAAVSMARGLADSPEAAARWVGKDALKDLTRLAVMRRHAARRQ